MDPVVGVQNLLSEPPHAKEAEYLGGPRLAEETRNADKECVTSHVDRVTELVSADPTTRLRADGGHGETDGPRIVRDKVALTKEDPTGRTKRTRGVLIRPIASMGEVAGRPDSDRRPASSITGSQAYCAVGIEVKGEEAAIGPVLVVRQGRSITRCRRRSVLAR
ncbi:MAG: hypothetical protein M1816_006702 [Peltula sp. TS41687]|nr:MAG: hypothetical protein M1816_006702 [Peltula sp. TS41687]